VQFQKRREVTYRIKNWHKFQHFKDRKPPWVKLYRDILDDLDWHELDAKAAKVLVSLWLISSEDDGYLPEVKKLAFRLRMSEANTLDVLSKLTHWLEQTDIEPISDGYQDDRPETERETETEGSRKARFCLPDGIPADAWKGYEDMRTRIKKPMTDRARGLVIKELLKLRDEGHDPAAVLDRSTVKGWTDVYPLKGDAAMPKAQFV
jgi:hypothetical protein